MNDQQYTALVAALRRGAVVPDADVLAILRHTGRSIAELAADVMRPEPPVGPAPGSPCSACGECIVVRSSRRADRHQVQYLACPACGAQAGRRIVPEASIRRRKQTVVTTT